MFFGSLPRYYGSTVSTARLGLIIVVIATLAYSWAPFDFALDNLRPERLSPVFQPIRTVGQTSDLAPHFLVFVGLAILFVLSRPARSLGRAVLTLTLLAIVVEFGQLFMAGRHAQVFDAIAHLFGALAGLVAGVYLQEKLGGATSFRRYERQLQTGIFAVAAVAWLAIAWFPLLVSSLRGWDESFPLMIGDEVGGGRAWHGEIRYLALYNRALGPAEAARCFDTVSDPDGTRYREEIGLLAGYDFELTRESHLILKAQPSSIRRVHGSTEVSLPTLVSTDGSARNLTRQLSRSGAFSVEVWARPDTLTQSGPARIVTLSSGPWIRNFTLGQERDALVFRVRNPISGPNGTTHQLEAWGILREELQHIVASYDRGVSALFVDGRKAGPTRDLRSPALLLGLGDRPVAEAVLVLLCVLPLIASARTLLAVRRIAVFFFPAVILLGLLPRLLSEPVNAPATRAVRIGYFVMAAGLALLLSLRWSRVIEPHAFDKTPAREVL